MMDCLRDRSGRSERAGWLWSTDHGRASTVGERARAGKRTPAACGTKNTKQPSTCVEWRGGAGSQGDCRHTCNGGGHWGYVRGGSREGGVASQCRSCVEGHQGARRGADAARRRSDTGIQNDETAVPGVAPQARKEGRGVGGGCTWLGGGSGRGKGQGLGHRWPVGAEAGDGRPE